MERLGKYEVLERLGGGGMGEVFLARHVLLEVNRAVKVMLPELSLQAGFREQFMNEAKILAKLDHPNIVRVYELDEDGSNYFIVMDFVSPDGQRALAVDGLLKQRGGKLPADETARLMVQVCHGIEYAHERGIVHRDIKPANLLVDKGDRIRISDFGLAQIVGEEYFKKSVIQSMSASLGLARTHVQTPARGGMQQSLGMEASEGGRSSSSSAMVGTFHFMPPEVQEGQVWSKQGDIYSIGVLAYLLLTGSYPTGRYKLPQELDPSISPVWNTVVERAMQREPRDRYDSVSALCEDILLAYPLLDSQRNDSALRVTSHGEIPESAIRLIRDFVNQRQAKWEDKALYRFSIEFYRYPGHDPVTQEQFERLLEDERVVWLEREAKRKEDEAGRAAEAERMRREAEEARKKAQEAKKAEAERLKRQEEANRLRQFQTEYDQSKAEYEAADRALAEIQRKCKKAEPASAGFFRSLLGGRADAEQHKALLDEQRQAEAVLRAAEARMNEAARRLESVQVSGGVSGKTLRVMLPGNVTIDFIRAPAGSFQMGGKESNEVPQHRVTISKDFWLGKYPVTQAQWQAVMGNNPSNFKGNSLPVEQVSWNDCQTFIKKLNALGQGAFRLPSEAEWEYACRAGSTTEYCFGDNESALGDYAWFDQNSDSKIHPVGEKKPNAWGLHDMHGNVLEWCQDWYHHDYSGAPTDASAWEAPASQHRVLRGGSWNFNASYCRAAYRDPYSPALRLNLIGVRLVRTL